MPRQSRPAVRKALSYLVEKISEGNCPAGSTLPSLKTLAVECDVSLLTMWKASAILKQHGIITGGSGNSHKVISSECGFLLDELDSGKDSTSLQPSDVTFAWERTKIRIRKDILTGQYSESQALPTIKELSAHYGTSYRTAKRAINALCKDGILQVEGRSYHIVQSQPLQSQSKIVLIAQCDTTGRLLLSSVNEAWFRVIEDVCATSRARFETIGYLGGDDEFAFISDDGTHRELPSGDRILGHLMIITNNEPNKEEVIRRLSHHKKPLAVLDLAGGWSLPSRMQWPQIRIFSAAVLPSAARDVARFLLELDHRRVAYISPYHKAQWSHVRLEGIVDIYKNADLPDGVVPVTFTQPQGFYRSTAKLKANLTDLFEFHKEWTRGMPEEYRRVLDPIFIDLIPNRSLYVAELNYFLRSLFRKALADREITAWICANDQVAIAAYDYCRAHGVAIPERLWIIGFDDSYEALERGITSYNFNIRGIIHAMIGYILNTRTYAGLHFRKPIEIEGTIVQRRTTGKSQRRFQSVSSRRTPSPTSDRSSAL
ncbi:MAG: GntR family transcriptional regulator [Chitinivibrionales bacterium]|nr:GntR family transcriptional regulator [Chitinivibrionales bacterium]